MSPPRAKTDALFGPGPASAVWLDLASLAVACIAGQAGFSAAVIDREHGAIGIETAAAMTAILRAGGTPALVRVPDRSAPAIQQALDAGAAGVIVPCLEDAATAEAVVEAALYPPRGRRGAAGAVIAATGYGADAGYARRWNDEALVVLQIESLGGLAAAQAIGAVSGVDMLFFGPFDYAMDAGLDPAADAAALWEAFSRVVAAAHGTGCLVGVFPWPGAGPAALEAAGADLVVRASDVVVLRQGFATARA